MCYVRNPTQDRPRKIIRTIYDQPGCPSYPPPKRRRDITLTALDREEHA